MQSCYIVFEMRCNTVVRVLSLSLFCGGLAALIAGAILTITPLVIGGFLCVGAGALTFFGTSLNRRSRTA
jgi:hypothetical protein